MSTDAALDLTQDMVVKDPDSGALRYNTGKVRYDLLPPDAIHELAKVYTMGAAKYEARNWEKGFSYSSCFASMARHAFKWLAGEDKDEESGLHHMAHVAWNAIALLTFQLRGIGTDDRSKTAPLV